MRGIVLAILLYMFVSFFYFFSFQDLEEERPSQITLEDVELKLGYYPSKHAKERMRERHISAEDIYSTLLNGHKLYDTVTKSDVYRYRDTNVIVVERTILTVFCGNRKSKWIETDTDGRYKKKANPRERARSVLG